MSSFYFVGNTFTLKKASFLFCDHDPLPEWRIKNQVDPNESIRQEADYVAEELEADCRSGKLKVFYKKGVQITFRKDGDSDEEYIEKCEIKRRIFPSMRRLSLQDRWYVKRDDLKDWAKGKNAKPKFLFPEEKTPNINMEQSKYTTPDLEILKEAIQLFWENHDPNRPPKNSEVIPWLMEKGMNENIAKAVCTMMKTKKAKKGGNKSRHR